jgi:hypothetical protein
VVIENAERGVFAPIGDGMTESNLGANGIQKIAILGGGPSGLSAAYHLTSPDFNPNWQKNYEITVYQLGWRLGGKGASGRNQDIADRIEEHGIHLFGNMYSNALHMLNKVYSEVEWKSTEPVTTMAEAVRQSDFQCVTDFYDEKWHLLSSWLPENAEVPWEGGAYATADDIVKGLLRVMASILNGGKAPPGAGSVSSGDSSGEILAKTTGLLADLHLPDLGLLTKPLQWALAAM